MTGRTFVRFARIALLAAVLGSLAAAAGASEPQWPQVTLSSTRINRVTAGAALAAGLPSPGNSTISANRINLVGFDPSVAGDQADAAAPGALVSVVVRDVANNPLPGVPVWIDFSQCADVRVAAAQSWQGLVTDCPAPNVTGVTDANGAMSFVVIGTSGPGAPHTRNSARVLAGSGDILALYFGVGTYDYDGGGIALSDLAEFTRDLFGLQDPDRSDFNGDGFVSIGDLSLFARAYFGGHSIANGAVLCP